MIDIALIREQPDRVREALLKRMDSVDLDRILELDSARREIQGEADALKEKRNKVSKDIPRLKQAGEDVSGLLEEMKSVSGVIKELDGRLSETEEKLDDLLLRLPNMPDPDVPAGGKEANEVLREWGEKPEPDFEQKDHVELVERLGLIDYERGVKLGGNGFWIYTGNGARMEWALLNYFIDSHLADGYEFILPPHILLYRCGVTAGQFPKFTDDVFQLKTDNFQFILPTAETALINFHRDEVLREAELPKKYFAYTPCYRREAGSYRTEERGMIRGHQFNKVEMFQFTRPEDSDAALKELLEKAERLVQGLGLHYRISKLAAKDCSTPAAKTFDIEVWIPSMGDYKEISSVSNTRDYQARRGGIRFKRAETKKNEFIHALNASGLATSRLLPAIVEQFQNKDGSVTLPKPLADRMGMERFLPTEAE
jgi:seryl-tRNA synthetase